MNREKEVDLSEIMREYAALREKVTAIIIEKMCIESVTQYLCLVAEELELESGMAEKVKYTVSF